MIKNFKKFGLELHAYNDILNATESRDYVSEATFSDVGYTVVFHDELNELMALIIAKNNDVVIVPQAAKYEEQHILFDDTPCTVEEFIEVINDIFYEVDEVGGFTVAE